jgi:membrane protein DedA with SNARE-associated domain
LHGWEEQVVQFLQSLFDTVGWFGVVLGMAIESCNIPLPSELIMPLSGWMLVDSLRGILWAGLAGGTGCTIGSAASYWIGYKGGRPLVLRYGKYVLLSKHDLDRADRWFARWGDSAAFFSRLLPVVRTFISFPAGISRVRFWKFLLYTFLGSCIWSAALAYAGYLFGQNWRDVREVMRPFDIPIVVIIVALAAWFVYRHLRHRDKGGETEVAE